MSENIDSNLKITISFCGKTMCLKGAWNLGLKLLRASTPMRMKIEKRVGNVNDSLVKESIALNFVLSITTLRHTILRSKSFITYQILFRQESQDKIRLEL